MLTKMSEDAAGLLNEKQAIAILAVAGVVFLGATLLLVSVVCRKFLTNEDRQDKAPKTRRDAMLDEGPGRGYSWIHRDDEPPLIVDVDEPQLVLDKQEKKDKVDKDGEFRAFPHKKKHDEIGGPHGFILRLLGLSADASQTEMSATDFETDPVRTRKEVVGVDEEEIVGVDEKASTSETSTIAEEKKYVLPFHQSLFEDVPLANQVCFVLWICSFGPLILFSRLFFTVVLVQLFRLNDPTTNEFFVKWILGWRIMSTTPIGEKDESGTKPIIFLTSHHHTYDLGFVRVAASRELGLKPKLMVHPKVFNSQMIKFLGTDNRNKFLFTTNGQDMTFLEMFDKWANDEGSEGTSMVVAPAGMTTHSNFITPMYYKYFCNPKTTKVVVNVDTTAAFGVKLRNLTTDSIMAEIVSLMLPWTKAEVTFHFGAVPEDVSSQEQVNCLVKDLYHKHHRKNFAPGWTQKKRRNIDKYIRHGEYVNIQDLDSFRPDEDQDSLSFDSDLPYIPRAIVSKLPNGIRYVTDHLINNPKLSGWDDTEIALVDPCTAADEFIAACHNIPMARVAVGTQFDVFEVKINEKLQSLGGVAKRMSQGFHHVFIERNLILVATTLFASGLWPSELLLFAQMTTMVQVLLLTIKLWINRPRPVWLSTVEPIQSLVDDLQVDSSFPSGHSSFFALLAITSFYEADIISFHVQMILMSLWIAGSLGRIHVGAHFCSDVLIGSGFAAVFISIFYASGGDEWLFSRIGSNGSFDEYAERGNQDDLLQGWLKAVGMTTVPSKESSLVLSLVKYFSEVPPSSNAEYLDEVKAELSFMVRFTICLVALQMFALIATNMLRPSPSPLDRDTYFRNNLSRLSDSKQKNLLEGEEAKPCGPSRDFLAPFIAVSSVVFWVHPLIGLIYIEAGRLPFNDVDSTVRFFGSMLALSYILAIVVPCRKICSKIFKKAHMTRFFALILVYISMLVVASLFCFFAIQAILTLQAKGPCETCEIKSVSLENGIQLEYAYKSTSNATGAVPTLLLLPGYISSWQFYGTMIDELPPNIQVFSPSLRGCGNSDKPTSGYSMEDYTEDVIQFLDQELSQVEASDLTIAGHSMGGLVAQRMALLYPERFSRLILVGTSGNPNPFTNEQLRDLLREVVHQDNYMVPQYLSLGMRLSLLNIQRDNRRIVNIGSRESAKSPSHVWQQSSLTMALTNHLGNLSAIEMPTMVAWGTNDDVFPRQDQMDLLSAIGSNARFMEYEDAHHDLPWEVSKELARDIAQFAMEGKSF